MVKRILHVSTGFTVLSILASGFNFLYYPLIARMLTYSQFGEVQVGTAFIMQAAALFTSLNILSLFFAAQQSNSKPLASRIERLVIAASLLLAVAVSIFAQPLASNLQLADPRLLYILSVIFLVNIPAATWVGALQGNGQFLASGVISCVSAFVKMAGAALLILLGLGAYGAMLGLLLGTLLILPLAYFAQKGRLLSFRNTFALPLRSDVTYFKNRPQIIVIFASLFLLAITSTLDVIVSKSALLPEAAGKYAQLSTAAKIPYFAALPLTIIFFERFIKSPATSKKFVLTFTAYVGLVFGLTLALQKVVINILFGTASYDSATFSLACVAFTLYGLVTLLAYRLISAHATTRALIAGLVVLAAPLAAMLLHHHTANEIALSFCAGQAIALLVAIIMQYTRRNG